MATQRVTYKMYNMGNTPPRVPIYQPAAQNVTPVISTAALPAEVAVCLSYRGTLISGSVQARRRGRVYIGQLNTAAVEVDALTGQPRPAVALRTALTAGANRMHDDLAAQAIVWCVYSPTTRGGGAAHTACVPISDVWVDDAFDTQRRRGPAPTTRTAVTV